MKVFYDGMLRHIQGSDGTNENQPGLDEAGREAKRAIT
jgi:hypothetical protein